MQIVLSNVKATLAPQGLDPENAGDTNAITSKLLAILPYLQGWGYDAPGDTITIDNPVVIPASISTVGEAVPGDYVIG